jgi:hypothetical protein
MFPQIKGQAGAVLVLEKKPFRRVIAFRGGIINTAISAQEIEVKPEIAILY